MRPLIELNINIGGMQNKKPSPTLKDFNRLERLVGFPIPDSYKSLLECSNGGHPELDTVFIEGEWSVDRFFHLGETGSHLESVEWNYRNKGDKTPKSFLPVGRDGGGNLFCLDLSDSDGPVFIVILDSLPSKHLKLRDSFESFIDSLSQNPDFI